ncbi:adenylate kinase [uncultured Jatrophihabitans sp.]|uniref:adenylate kinase n=1 Tax=uncultured Jatrophihabitans sp. TaxID=1610747 RepID=UPI0035CB16B7
MQRVLVAGITGAGKTTAAQRIGQRIGAPFHEMDALAIGPEWSTPPDFVANVERILVEPRWVFDSYGYEQVREAMWAAADTVIWLDYPLRVVAPRIVRRSLSRSWRRTPVFGGNIETWRSWLTADHPVWWALRQHGARRRAIADLVRRAGPGLHVVHLTSPRAFERWLGTDVDADVD